MAQGLELVGSIRPTWPVTAPPPLPLGPFLRGGGSACPPAVAAGMMPSSAGVWRRSVRPWRPGLLAPPRPPRGSVAFATGSAGALPTLVGSLLALLHVWWHSCLLHVWFT